MITAEFITAGNAIFTVEVPAVFREKYPEYAEHYTYRVNFREGSNGYADTYFVSLLTGANNETDYTYMGMLDQNDTTPSVRLTKASKYGRDSAPVKLLNKVLAALWEDRYLDMVMHGFDVHHIGKCGRCGNPLTTPESIKRGIGPVCAGKM